MITLPSGRQIAFSLDRFHALMARLDNRQALAVMEQLEEPDDLLFVLDAVHFSQTDGKPYFPGYVAADWKLYAADWSQADREALAAWLVSADARLGRAMAIRYIKSLLDERERGCAPYPYHIVGHGRPHEGSRQLQ